MKKKSATILNYTAVFQEEKSGGYSVWVPELPGCASQGETIDEAKKNIEEAISLYLKDAPCDVVKEAINRPSQFFMPVNVSVVYG